VDLAPIKGLLNTWDDSWLSAFQQKNLPQSL